MRRFLILALLVGVLSKHGVCIATETHRYLFIGHPRDDRPGEIVQRDVERIDYSAYDLLLLGGDYTWRGTGTRETVAYLDAVFDLAAPTTLAALGNHDTSNKSYFTDVTGRPRFYTYVANGITFVILDTTDDGQDILDAELEMLEDTLNALSDSTHLVVIHHHILWLADYPPLAHLKGSPLVGASSGNLSGLNFFDVVYPLLLKARAKGVDVLCLAGDRTGTETEEFFIDHTTADDVRFVAAGFKEELSADLRTAVILDHDVEARTLECTFKHLSELPRIPDETFVINELHYAPSSGQGDASAFIELFNGGSESYDISSATFSSGVTFTFPADTNVTPGEYILIAAKPNRYADLGVRVFAFEEETLAESDSPIMLRSSNGLVIDYVDYSSSAPWPSLSNRQGHSVMLTQPSLDNVLPASWAVSDELGGTPGKANTVPLVLGIVTIDDAGIAMQWHGAVTGARYRIE